MMLWLLISSAHADGTLGGLPSVVGLGDQQPLLHAQPAGDLDGDGLGDMVFGAPYDDTAIGHESGQVWILSGADLTAVSRWTPIQDVAVGLSGEATQDHAGYDVAAVGDVNGDGLADVTVGAPDASAVQPTAGKVYVVFGRTGFAPGSLGDEDQFFGSSNLTHLGARVYSAGDIDGDGMNEVLLGAPWPTPNGTPGPGFMALFYGRADGWDIAQPVTMDYSPNSAATSADAVFLVFASETYAGRSAAMVPDPLGDGRDGLLLGVPGYTDPFSKHTDDPTGPAPPHGGLGASEPGSGHMHTLAHGAAYLMTAPDIDGNFVVRDDAHGTVFGEAAGDMLPWEIAVLSDGRAALSSPDANETAGGVWLLSDLTGQQSVTDADVIWTGRDAGDLAGWSVAAIDGIDSESTVAIGSPGWEGGLGRISLVGNEGGLINDAALMHIRGCLEDGLAGWSVRSHPGPAPDGSMQPWVGITAPSASVYADGDGAAYILTAEDLDRLGGDCELPDNVEIDADGDGYSSEEDCDDGTAWVHPNAIEVCGNGADEDCDGDIDEDCGPVPSSGCSTVSGTTFLWFLLLPLLLRTRRSSAAIGAALLFPAVGQAEEPIALIWGSAAEEYLQGPLATGDFNGDGQVDLAVANHRGFAVEYATGEVFLIDGAELSGTLDLNGWSDVLYGETEHDYLGRDLVVLPHDDGDGLLVGQTFAGLTSAEQGELVRFDGPLLDGIPRRVDTAPAVIMGDAETDWLGEQVRMVGDLDGDGVDDIAASAPTRNSEEGQTAGMVWIFHDDITALEGSVVAPQLASARIAGRAGSQTGWRLLAPGDLDGDGRDDLIVGVVNEDDFSGRLAVFSGVERDASLFSDEQIDAWILPEPDSYPGFGLASGDVDEDGLHEVVIGSHTAASGAGQVWLLDGRPDGLRNITQDAMATFVGEPGEGIGYSVAIGPAILVGAPTSGTLHVLDHMLQPINHTVGTELGRWVGWLPDLNGDGIEDAGIVDSAATGSQPQQGAAWLVSGAAVVDGDLSALTDTVEGVDADGDGSVAGEDCDDGDPRRASTLTEICQDGLDNDCDGLQDEDDCARSCATVHAKDFGVMGLVLAAMLLIRRQQRRPT